MVVPHDLYVISFSHYCEAARWALQASNIAFTEHRALPGLHRLPLLFPAKDSSGDRMTPFLRKSEDGTYLRTSWEVLEFARRGRSVPEDVKECLDSTVGPAVRSVFYSYVLDHPCCFDKQVEQASVLQRVLWSVAGGTIKLRLKDMMVKDATYIEGQKVKLERGWQVLQERLQSPDNPFHILDDGKPNTACIALCAIAGSILGPENQYGGIVRPLLSEDLPEGLLQIRQRYRTTPLGEFILKVYKETRML